MLSEGDMKKVLLVNTNVEKLPYPVPPLGVCLLASSLSVCYDVRVYDGTFDEGRSLPELVKQFLPDYIGFSIRNIDDVVIDRPVFYPERILTDFIIPVKQVTSVPLILGGSGFSIFPGELMGMTGADYGIAGEGEELLVGLLQCLDCGGDIRSIPGLYLKTVQNTSRSVRSMPMFRSLFSETDRYIDFSPYKTKGVYSIQTKRGCALQCIYCTYPLIEGRKYRLRNPSEIVREMRELQERVGDVMIEFVDSTFNEPHGHAEDICRAIIDQGLQVRLRTMGINPRHATRELFELMIRAGFTQIDVTPDSASSPVIQRMKKGFRLEDIRRTATLIREFDLPTMWFFLFGGPGETEETVGETVSFIEEYINPEDLVYLNTGLRIYPNTPLYRIAVHEKVIQTGNPVFFPPVFYISPGIGKEKLGEMIREVCTRNPNCLPSSDTAPSRELLIQAVKVRERDRLTEPMFRTLLRLRQSQIQTTCPNDFKKTSGE